ncbi:hypothetical protein [Lysobacter capsici]|uniref:hypothetical protein n=1 Tax=Lysobacter capsici TaxID=435897 RepID=UPI001C008B70|nr:hypothetical protein [Lysobacter capsici]MBW8810310.1 hypothetical protein [Lysobacter sp.]QWF19362.1 hypothetical protein KME82_11795 [Lysobacter capsici]
MLVEKSNFEWYFFLAWMPDGEVMDRPNRLIGNTRPDGRLNLGPGSRPATSAPIRSGAETDSPKGGGESERSGRAGASPPGAASHPDPLLPRRPNPVERYIACFPTARAAAEAAGISTAMLRRMRGRGYVSTRHRALLMAQACRFKVKPAELMALTGTGR